MRLLVSAFSLAFLLSLNILTGCSRDLPSDEELLASCETLNAQPELPPITAEQQEQANALMKGLGVILGSSYEETSSEPFTFDETRRLANALKAAHVSRDCVETPPQENATATTGRYFLFTGKGCPINLEFTRQMTAYADYNAWDGTSRLNVRKDFDWLGLRSARITSRGLIPTSGRLKHSSASSGFLVTSKGETVQVKMKLAVCHSEVPKIEEYEVRLRLEFPHFSTEIFGQGLARTDDRDSPDSATHYVHGSKVSAEDVYRAMHPEHRVRHDTFTFFTAFAHRQFDPKTGQIDLSPHSETPAEPVHAPTPPAAD